METLITLKEMKEEIIEQMSAENWNMVTEEERLILVKRYEALTVAITELSTIQCCMV